MTRAEQHVVVVGGGIVGCAVAFRLVRAGMRVTLIEPDPFGTHASGRNAGNLNPLFMTPPPLIPLALDAFARHPEVARELAELDCGTYALEPLRRLVLADTPDALRQLDDLALRFVDREGFTVERLDQEQARAREPRLAKSVTGAILMEGNLSVDAERMTRALAEGAARLGADMRRTRVDSLRVSGTRVTGVLCGGDAIACDAVVLATGPWIDATERWLGIRLPIRPVKGQLLRMKMPGAGLPYDLTWGESALYRRGNDEVWVGGTQEHVGLDETPTPEAFERLMAGARRILPCMKEAVLIEHTASLRAMTPGGLPLVGPLKNWKQVYIANGGGTKGVLLSVSIAQAVCDWIIEGGTRVPLPVERLEE